MLQVLYFFDPVKTFLTFTNARFWFAATSTVFDMRSSFIPCKSWKASMLQYGFVGRRNTKNDNVGVSEAVRIGSFWVNLLRVIETWAL